MVEFTPHFSSEASDDDDESEEEKKKDEKQKKQSAASLFRSLGISRDKEDVEKDKKADEVASKKPIADLGALLTGVSANEEVITQEQPEETLLEELIVEEEAISKLEVEADATEYDQAAGFTDASELSTVESSDTASNDEEWSEPTALKPRSIFGSNSRHSTTQPSRRTVLMTPVGARPIDSGARTEPHQPIDGRFDSLPPQTNDRIVAIQGRTPERHEDRDPSNPLLALFGGGLLLEHIFRKRADRRLSKEVGRSLQEEKQEYEKKYDYLVREHTATRTHENFLDKSIELLKNKQQTTENYLHKGGQAEGLDNSSGARRFEYSAVKTTPENIILQPEEKEIQSQKQTEQIIRTELKSPETTAHNIVYEQTVEAAEKNAAVERLYERRSEVKDDPSAAIHQGVDVSQSTFVQPSQANRQQLEQDLATMHNFDATNGQPGMYRSAMNWGFAVAAAIVVFAIVAYALIR